MRHYPSSRMTGPEVWAEAPANPAARILIVLHDFSGGGTERVAIRLANQWAKAGRTVRIFCGDETGPVRTLVDDRVIVEQANPPLPRSPLSRIRLGLALADAARRYAPDAIFAPGNFHMLVLAAFAVRDRSGAATLCKISNPLVRADRRGPVGWLRRGILRLLTARIDALVAMSPALRSEAMAFVSDRRVAARWEPIFTTIAPQQFAAREPDLILAVGRLEPQKNFALAIAAMAHLSRTQAQLVILGEGSERATLTTLIARLGLQGRVLLPGHVADVTPWLQRAGCVLMTSRYEGYPASLVEAVAQGAPLVVTPCSSALEEILPFASMAKIAPAEAEAVARAVDDILSHPPSPSTAPLLLARHSDESAATAYLSLIDEVVAHGARHPGARYPALAS